VTICDDLNPVENGSTNNQTTGAVDTVPIVLQLRPFVDEVTPDGKPMSKLRTQDPSLHNVFKGGLAYLHGRRISFGLAHRS
jgi:hypothetical protein